MDLVKTFNFISLVAAEIGGIEIETKVSIGRIFAIKNYKGQKSSAKEDISSREWICEED